MAVVQEVSGCTVCGVDVVDGLVVQDRVGAWVGVEPQVSERDADPGGVCVSVCVPLIQMSEGSVNVLHSSQK